MIGQGQQTTFVRVSQSDFPVDRLSPGDALAVITGIEGPAYRPCGAGMAITSEGARIGSLSSGCIDQDVALHALAAMTDGQARRLRYGHGSPFFDIKLPCGGGIDVLVLPRLDPHHIVAVRAQLAGRQPALLNLGPVILNILPPVRCLVLGKGVEALTFAAVARAAGCVVEIASPDEDTCDQAGPCPVHLLTDHGWPFELRVDARTAITYFFHDHDCEPQLLETALASKAFYVGAMGSRRAAEKRRAALAELGMAQHQIDRLATPFGSVPSTRNPRTLAVSVLCDILSQAEAE